MNCENEDDQDRVFKYLRGTSYLRTSIQDRANLCSSVRPRRPYIASEQYGRLIQTSVLEIA